MKKSRFFLVVPMLVLTFAMLAFSPTHASAATAAKKAHQPHIMARGAFAGPHAGSANNMVYGGGPVMTGNVKVHLVYWLPAGHSFSSGYQSLLQRFFTDFDQTSVFSVIHQYTNNSGQNPQSVSFGGAWTDTSAYPGSTIFDSNIRAETQKAVSQNGWSTGYSDIVLVYTPADVTVCFDGTSQCSNNTFCAYHDGFDANNQAYVYSSIPDENGCGITSSPNNNKSADGSIDSSSHELMEAMSDARPNSGWSNSSVGEIGDPCAHTYGPAINSNGADVTGNGNYYLIQPEWSNSVSGCSMGSTTPPPPPPPPAGGITNGGFESGSLSSWTTGGSSSTVSTAQKHTGSYSALLGTASGSNEPNGDSSISQTIKLPSSGTHTLTFWYRPSTTDTIQYDWQEAQVRSSSGGTLASIFKVCSNSKQWTQVSYNLSSYDGQTVQLWFNAHQDGAGDVTSMYLDDVSLS